MFECFGNYPEIQEKCKKVWILLAKIDTFVSKRDPSDEEIEEGAKDCESFCNIFPPLFPNRNLTPKMYILSCVLPK